jgi:anti-sigma regulatory factor (Ser/Thr protein kinase)
MPDELALDLSLPRLKTAGGLARRAIRERFADGLGCERTDELSLVVTELVSNAVVHGQGAIKLAVRVDGDRVQGEVIDEGGGFEHEVRERGPEDFTGRGLSIVAALSNRWGIHEGTTHVWFELAIADATPKHTAPQLGEDQALGLLDKAP